jgi:glutamyl-tRNA synthetase
MAQGSLFFFREPVMDEKAVAKHLTPEGRALLVELRSVLSGLPAWDAATLHAAVQAFAESRQLGLGKIAQPLRVALTGGTISPPIDATLALLGREKVLARVDAALG